MTHMCIHSHTAISYYRQAIQLVPDIEHKMCYNDQTTSSLQQGVYTVSMVTAHCIHGNYLLYLW